MNLLEAYKLGQKGANRGLPMGKGLKKLSSILNGVQRARIYTVGAPPKGGKSTLVDYGFVIEPCLYVLQHNPKIQARIDILKTEYFQYDTTEERKMEVLKQKEVLEAQLIDLEIIYNSYEIDRVSKEFDFMSHFLNRDHGIENIGLPEGKTCRGEKIIPLSAEYLMGQLVYDTATEEEEPETIKVLPSIFELIPGIYEKRIVPLFGEYNSLGNQTKKGLITFLEHKENPTGIRNYLIRRAESKGIFSHSVSKDNTGVEHKRITGYKPNNPNEFVLVVTDHLRKLIPERNFNLKQTVDKFSEYAVELRNTCKYAFVHIIHLNRAMADTNRIKFADENLYPTSEDFKDTGNLSEDSNYVLTMMNPNDDKYMLKKHFGRKIRDTNNNPLYEHMRTIHLVESRHCMYPQHLAVNMYGAVKKFEDLIIKP